LNEAKQVRDKKRQEVMHAKRMIATMPPRVVAVMPTSEGVDLPAFWSRLVAACDEDADGAAVAGGPGGDTMEVEMALNEPLVPRTLVAGPQKKVKLTLVPSLNVSDPLAVVDVAKSADVLLCVLPGDGQEATIDAAGEDAIRIMRSLGLPSVLAVTQTPEGAKGVNVMKARSAAKKRAMDALGKFVPVESYKVMAADTAVDFRQVVRHITDSAVSVPGWRQQRSHIIAEQATYDDASSSLLLTGYVRHKGLTAQQLIHVPGAGDFQIAKIEAAEEPVRAAKGTGSVDAEMGGVIAVSTPEEREPLVRENEVDPLDAEQTWPTEEELAEAEKANKNRRRLPKGTSEYQAAWIVDEAFSDDSEGDDDGSDDEAGNDLRPAKGRENGEACMEEGDYHETNWLMNDTGTDMDPDEFNKIDLNDDRELEKTREEDAARRAREADDVLYPDEFELHHGEAARRRLAKFRGLKSFRTSPWDPREDLPLDYAKVFAFENFRRAQKRAVDLSNKVNRYNGPVGADVGAYVRITIPGVSQAAGRATVERVDAASRGLAPLLSAWGLLQHEVKMSVLNFSVRKEVGVTDPIANKEELLFVTGTRTYPAKPIYSTDEHGADKHKMERFLHDGRMAMATIYGPITYPPSPLLAFKRNPFDGSLRLVATGSLKSCDPDRVVIKKIVLTGFPVKTHRSKAIVRSMFFTPEDIRWFSPVELWTKLGRRGRIREPLGTHGLFKAIFDGPLSQQDTVCLSLYKRAFPKAWDDGRVASL
jgi:pre-rRNA-processing protein TSR1